MCVGPNVESHAAPSTVRPPFTPFLYLPFPMFLMKRIALSVFAAVVCLNGVLQAQVYDTPEKANQDEDFALQGEYTDSTRGLQVIALGDGEFQKMEVVVGADVVETAHLAC